MTIISSSKRYPVQRVPIPEIVRRIRKTSRRQCAQRETVPFWETQHRCRDRLRVHLGVTPALFTTSCRGKTVDTTATVKRYAPDGSHSTTVLLLWSTCCTFAFHTFLGDISKHNQIAIANDLIPYSRNSPQTEKSIPNE